MQSLDLRLKGLSGIRVLAAALFLSSIFIPLASCSAGGMFGELIIGGDIDLRTLEPIDIGGQYSIDSPQIAAAVKVSGVRGDDRWRFTWRNSGTGEVIADSTGTYSMDNSAFVEGYISNRLLPAEGSGIIAEPGEYTVSYYHNSELKAEAGFTIQKPSAEIMEAGMSKGLDQDGKPAGNSREFYQDDEIYAFIRLDHKISGDRFGIKWYRDDIFLGDEEYTIRQNSYMPGYIIFQLLNEEQPAFPAGSYRLEIISRDEAWQEYVFEVVPLEYDDGIFAGNQVYADQDFGFRVSYPDGWSLEKEDIEAGLKAGFTPDDGIRQIIIDMWVLKEDFSPSPDEYSSFADQRVEELKEQGLEDDIKKTESVTDAGDMKLFEVRYDNIDEAGGGWSMTFSFMEKSGLLFLFMRLTDPAYIDYGEKVVDYMIRTISFEE
jgi:hypothetical protein